MGRVLCKTNEMLGGALLSLHNVWFFHGLMQRMREAVASGTLPQLRAEVLPRVEPRRSPKA